MKTALTQPVVWSLPLKSLLGIIVAAYRGASLCPQKEIERKLQLHNVSLPLKTVLDGLAVRIPRQRGVPRWP